MAKSIRSLKADLCDDETLAALTRDARYLFVGLITRADDHGRFRANPSLVRSRVYPYDDDVTSVMVAGWLGELQSAERVCLYETDGQSYGVFINWCKHQRIDNAAKSEFPPPPAASCGELPLEGIGEEGIGEDAAAAHLCPEPFVIDNKLREWGATRAPAVDLDLLAEKMTLWSRAKGVKRKSWRKTLQSWAIDNQGNVVAATAQPWGD